MRFRSGRAWLGALCVLAALSGTSQARADLSTDIGKIDRTWGAHGTTRVLAPRLLVQGSALPLPLEPGEVSGRDDACTSVVVLGAPSTSFVVRFLPDRRGKVPSRPIRPEVSVGGAVQFARCGRRRRQLRNVVVEMRSPRGVLQVVVGRGKKPFEALQRFLPHREAGPAAVATPPGPRPDNPAVVERAARLGDRLAEAGAAEVHRRLVPAGDDGAAFVTFELEPGCHALHALGISATSGTGPGLDVDMELVLTTSGSVVASDRSDSPDAAVSLCVGEPTDALLTVAGGVPRMPLLVVYARWPLPSGIPERWGGVPRAAVAEAMRARAMRELPERPTFEFLGVAGSTLSPVEVEPDACYVAAVAPLRGEPSALSISVTANGTFRNSHATSPHSAALLAFCANGTERARLNIEAHGPSLAWISAVWQVTRFGLGGVSGAR